MIKENVLATLLKTVETNLKSENFDKKFAEFIQKKLIYCSTNADKSFELT